MEEGRYTPAAFFDAVYNEIFPPDDTARAPEAHTVHASPPSCMRPVYSSIHALCGVQAHTVHYDKFRKELRQGDEIWLFDNSADAVRDNDRSLPPTLKHERVGA